MGATLRKRRHGWRHGWRRGSGASWHVVETYLKVRGRWCYLHRAIDHAGNLIDAMLSVHRDMKAELLNDGIWPEIGQIRSTVRGLGLQTEMPALHAQSMVPKLVVADAAPMTIRGRCSG